MTVAKQFTQLMQDSTTVTVASRVSEMLSSVVIEVARRKGNRASFLSPFMRKMSGDFGKALTDAFVNKDTATFETMWGELTQHMLAQVGPEAEESAVKLQMLDLFTISGGNASNMLVQPGSTVEAFLKLVPDVEVALDREAVESEQFLDYLSGVTQKLSDGKIDVNAAIEQIAEAVISLFFVGGDEDTSMTLRQDLMELVTSHDRYTGIENTLSDLGVSLHDMWHSLPTTAEIAMFEAAARKLTLSSVKKDLAEKGIEIKKEDDEYRVNYKGGKEPTAYYTNDLADALATGLLMAQKPVR